MSKEYTFVLCSSKRELFEEEFTMVGNFFDSIGLGFAKIYLLD
jgi:hypothetical protein